MKGRPLWWLMNRLESVAIRRLGVGVIGLVGRRKVLVLETTGRRTGRVRRTPVAYWRDRDGWLYVGAAYRSGMPGSPHPPSRTITNAKAKRLAAVAAYEQIGRHLDADRPPNRLIQTLRHNNDMLAARASPSSTRDCVEHPRTVADQPPAYVHRGPAPAGANPLTEARLELWAPEEDASEYYGRFRPMALEATIVAGARAVDGLAGLHPPPGVDGGAFYDLVSSRERGYIDNLLAIDQAANNTSVVLSVEWRGWRLLLPGDAETRGWKTMHREGVLRPVHFLKVGHHGSHNGTPPLELLDKILPDPAPDARPRFAAVSTYTGSYRGVPHPDAIHLLEQRCEPRSTEGLHDGEELRFEFPG